MRAITRRAASTIGLLAATGALMTAAAVPVTAAVDAPGGETRADVVVVPFGQRRAARDQHHVRQRALLPGQPERPVGSRADADPHEVPAEQRRRDVEHAHAADRPHRRGQPRDLLGPLRRPPRPAREQQLQELHGRANGATEPDTSFVYWNSPVDQQRHQGAVDSEHTPVDGLLADVPAANAAPPAQTAPAPWVAVQQGRLLVRRLLLGEHGAGEQRRHPDRVRALRRRLPPPCLQEHEPRSSARPCTAAWATPRASKRGGAVTDTPPAAEQPRHAARSRRCSGTSSSRRLVAAHATRPEPVPVADAAGNLVDLDNREIADFQGHVGFPGFSPTASQTLAMLADMQEAGVPVTFGYIADVHERKDWSFQCTTADATGFGNALGPGDSCYEENLQRYDQAFAKFLDRLAKDGIGPNNTLFVIGAEENDHFAGANVGRADAPADPANCDGVTIPCRYAHNQVGEVQANIVGLLAAERQQHDAVRRRAAGRVDLRAQPQRNGSVAARERSRGPPARAGHGRADGEQPAQRRPRRDDHELPGRRHRATHPSPRDRGSPAHADVHAVPEARLLLRRRGTELLDVHESGRRLRDGQLALRVGSRLLQPRHRHHLVVLRGPGREESRHRRAEPRRQPRCRGSGRGWARPRLQHTRNVGRRDRHPSDDALRWRASPTTT